ncbi:hypothetical protein TGRUB_219125 [Toxoplasma gondii RUB]|uniref:Uncharacterized protein n=1 Tax=Toxoplasma gondii RUB TaxID=935652 RepID=A0A086M7K2_TOXGO|nr:hypothetical protein TGRUB_219125 [Toxoplasma gondii RUB]
MLLSEVGGTLVTSGFLGLRRISQFDQPFSLLRIYCTRQERLRQAHRYRIFAGSARQLLVAMSVAVCHHEIDMRVRVSHTLVSPSPGFRRRHATSMSKEVH